MPNTYDRVSTFKILGNILTYLKINVILLAEVFENFRNNCLAAYELDPAHYYITPGLSWDAMLKNTQV